MGEKSVQELLDIHSRGKTDAERWRHLYRDAYRLVQPARDQIDNPQRGQRKHDVVFDSTGVASSAKAANRLQDLMFPTGKKIVTPKPGPMFENAEAEVVNRISDELNVINDRWHAALWRSNFQTVVNEGIQDLLIGTMSMLFNEGPPWDPFHFTAVPQFQIMLQEGAWGTIATVSRETRLRPQVAKQQWPNSKIDPKQQGSGSGPAEGDGDKRVYIEITYPDDASVIIPDGELMGVPTRWYYTVIDVEANKKIFEKDKVIEVASPWIVGRWQKVAEETRGRGPILQALPDIRTANKVVELVLKSASLAITGIWTAVDDGVFNPNTSKFTPGSFIPVASNGGSRGPSIAPLLFPGNFDVSQLVLEDIRTQIQKALFDNQLPPMNSPVRTATEFVARLRDVQMDIGPAAGRLQKEVIEPLYLRGLHILRRKNMISIPDELQLDSQSISLDVVSPLAQRQALDEVQKLVQYIELVSFLGPEILQLKVKIEDIPQWLSQQMGIDPKLLRPAEGEEGQQNVLEVVGQIMAANQMGAQNGQAQTPAPAPVAA